VVNVNEQRLQSAEMSESDRQVQISLPPEVVERPRSYFAFAQQRGPTTEAAKHCWVEVFAKLVPFLESLEGGNPATCTFSQYGWATTPCTAPASVFAVR
jgi:hypothetical protein